MAIHGADGAGRAHPRIELKYNPHEGVEEPYLVLADGENGVAAAKDLATYISRAKSVDKGAAIRLIARGTVLGVFACSLAPETLLDATPTILGTRALTLAAPSQLDIVVEAQALLDRLARIQESKMVLYLPPVTVNAVWAGQSAPVSGWARVGAVAASEFRQACREGLEAVDRSLPANPGAAVLATVRSRIWSSPMVLEHLPEFDNISVPTGAAFALKVFGFLPDAFEGELPVFVARSKSGEWTRIAAPGGQVLVRAATPSLQTV